MIPYDPAAEARLEAIRDNFRKIAADTEALHQKITRTAAVPAKSLDDVARFVSESNAARFPDSRTPWSPKDNR